MMQPTLGATLLLDRESQKRGDSGYLGGLATAAEARFLVLVEEKPVIVSNADRTETAIRWFTPAELQGLGLGDLPAIFLGVERQSRAGRFALALAVEEAARTPDLQQTLSPAVDLRTLAMQGVMPPDEISLLGAAKALAAWHDANGFCGRCGSETAAADGGWKRTCSACGHVAFPRIDPVVIMLITDGERCVLAREPRFADKMFSTIAGFIEPGEDIESAVRREAEEELGVEVGEVHFLSSQPWPFPHSLMLGCIGFAKLDRITIDPVEIVEARVVDRSEALAMLSGKHPDGLWVPGRQAIAHVLISAFANGTLPRLILEATATTDALPAA